MTSSKKKAQAGSGLFVFDEKHVENARLIISPEQRPRQGWGKAFHAAGSAVDEELLLGEMPNVFDREEWRW